MPGQRALEPGEAGEVEVVRGLVEQEHVEAVAEDGGERRPRLLPARARARVPLLREVADRERRRSAPDAPRVGLLEPGEQSEERGLAGAVRADEADPRARRHDEADVLEDDLGSVRLRDSGRDERAGEARHARLTSDSERKQQTVTCKDWADETGQLRIRGAGRRGAV
jgi:hypothetical protein